MATESTKDLNRDGSSIEKNTNRDGSSIEKDTNPEGLVKDLNREGSVKHLVSKFSKVNEVASSPISSSLPSTRTSASTLRMTKNELRQYYMTAPKGNSNPISIPNPKKGNFFESEKKSNLTINSSDKKQISVNSVTNFPETSFLDNKKYTIPNESILVNKIKGIKIDREVQTQEEVHENVHTNIIFTIDINSITRSILCIVDSKTMIEEILIQVTKSLNSSIDTFKSEDFFLYYTPSSSSETHIKLDPKKKICEYQIKENEVIFLKQENKSDSSNVNEIIHKSFSSEELKSTVPLKSVKEQAEKVFADIKSNEKNLKRTVIPGLNKSSGSLTSPHKSPKKKIPPKVSTTSQLVQDRRWKRRWIVLDEQTLYCFKNQQDSTPSLKIPLLCASVKIVPSSEYKKFELLGADCTYEFYTDSDKDLLQWTAVLEDLCQNLVHKSIGSSKHIPMSNSLDRNVIRQNKEEISAEKIELFKIMKLPGNSICADCDNPNPEWASVNLGIFICISCSGAHRNLGTHISKVRSCTLDDWDDEMVTFMKLHGNEKENAYWEGSLPKSVKKPTAKDGQTERQNFIHAKYERKEYIEKKPEIEMVFLSWENENRSIGFVELETTATLSTFRSMITDTGIEIKSPFYFLFRKAPLTSIQEQKKTILDCLVKIDGNHTILLRKVDG